MIDPKNIKQTKYQSVTLTVASGGTAGVKSSLSAGLDDSYDLCDGICITEVSDGSVTESYTVAVETPTGNPITFIPIEAVSVTKNDGTNPNERFVDVLFDAKAGKNAKLLIDIPSGATYAADIVVKATFRLRRTLVPVNVPKV